MDSVPALSSSTNNDFNQAPDVVSEPVKGVVQSSSQNKQKGVSESASNRSEQGSWTHLSRPFNQNHHQNQRQFGHGHGSNTRGRTPNGDGFRNQNYPNRRHHHQNRGGNFNNRQQGNARPANLHYRPPVFINAAPPNLVEPQRPPFPQFAHPNFPLMENHHQHQYFNFPHVPTPPPPPPHLLPPLLPPNHHQYPNFVMPMMYNGYSFYQEESTGLYGPPGMEPLPLMDVMRGPPVRPQPLPVVQNLPNPLPSLSNKILRQIDYYFSDENLQKDHYLRSKMNEQGWVSVHLIAEFNRVKKMTDDIGLILGALKPSQIVETQGDKLRKRGDWMNYILPAGISDIQSGINNIRLEMGSEAEVQKVESEG